jgi:hypothetical protein
MCDLRYLRNWHICDIFLKKQPEDEQETIAIQTVIRCNGKYLYFSNLPNEVFYCLNGIYCSTIGFKGHTGAIFRDTGQSESGLLILYHQKLSQNVCLWFRVNHEFTGNWFYGKMGLPGVTGG